MSDVIAQAGQYKVKFFDHLSYADYLACMDDKRKYLHLKRITSKKDLIHQAQEMLELAYESTLS